MQKKPIMYLLCIVVHCASVLSHTSDGWRHAFTYRWINVYKPLFITYTYVRTYVCIYVFLFAYTGFRCSILYESYTVQCIRIQLPGKRIHLFDKKKEKVKLDSYRWGLELQCHVR